MPPSRGNRKSTATSRAPTTAPKRFPGRPLVRAILQFLARLFRDALVCAIKLWISAVDAAIWCILWVWKNPWKSTKTATSIFFRIATLVSVGYLVYDRIYETSATASSVVSDPKDPFRMPFTITNNSHIFRLKNIAWSCEAIRIDTSPPSIMNNIGAVSGTKIELGPGQVMNFSCNLVGQAGMITIPGINIVGAALEIKFAYDADIFGWLWRRTPAPAAFAWESTATSSQWLKGEFSQ